MNNIDSEVRNVLKRAFVERIVITNLNPDFKDEEFDNAMLEIGCAVKKIKMQTPGD